MSRAIDALNRLRAGHGDFLAGRGGEPADRKQLGKMADEGQHPFATIVTCADSRVDPEVIFHCGLGDIFVVRSAGHVMSDIGLGSIEYAVSHLHTPIVLVLGHSRCGAVHGAVHGDSEHAHRCLASLLDAISPAVKQAGSEGIRDESKLADRAEDIHIDNTMIAIAHDLAQGGLDAKAVFGAKYDICTQQILYLNSIICNKDGSFSVCHGKWQISTSM